MALARHVLVAISLGLGVSLHAQAIDLSQRAAEVFAILDKDHDPSGVKWGTDIPHRPLLATRDWSISLDRKGRIRSYSDHKLRMDIGANREYDPSLPVMDEEVALQHGREIATKLADLSDWVQTWVELPERGRRGVTTVRFWPKKEIALSFIADGISVTFDSQSGEVTGVSAKYDTFYAPLVGLISREEALFMAEKAAGFKAQNPGGDLRYALKRKDPKDPQSEVFPAWDFYYDGEMILVDARNGVATVLGGLKSDPPRRASAEPTAPDSGMANPTEQSIVERGAPRKSGSGSSPEVPLVGVAAIAVIASGLGYLAGRRR